MITTGKHVLMQFEWRRPFETQLFLISFFGSHVDLSKWDFVIFFINSASPKPFHALKLNLAHCRQFDML